MWQAKVDPQYSEPEEEIIELAHFAEWLEETYPSEEELDLLRETEARRRALIALHVAGRARYGKAWDEKRAHWVEAATDGRTKSARECTTGELESATRFVARGSFPAYMRACADPELEDFTYLDGNPPVKWVAWADSGGCYADW